MICKICNKECKNILGLISHIRYHKLSSKEYYDKYFKTNVEGICECGKETKYIDISNGYRQFCCIQCKSKSKEIQDKIKQTNIEKYGCENPFGNKDIQNKIKQTNIKKYGGVGFQSKELSEKTKKTNLKKYGVENPLQNKEIREKIKKTCLKKYGCENQFGNKEIQEKRRQTNLEKYGVEHPIQNKKIKEKTKKTNLERYGVENPSNSVEIQEKRRQTNLEKYGVECPFQNKKIKEKIKQTNLKKYGVENYNQTKERLEYMKNGGSAYLNSFIKNPSKSQVELFELIKETYPTAIINYPVMNYSVDVVISELKVAFEYDGSYWHKDKEEYDKKRQKEIEYLGWRFIRYMDYIPSKNELANDINNILKD